MINDMKLEKERFKGQFSSEEWEQLCADPRFKAAWDALDLIKAGELAGEILKGNIPFLKDKKDIGVAKDLLDI